jgi:hypothetical protein
MRLSTIAVCLLLLAPCSVAACEDHGFQPTEWHHEAPSSFRELAWSRLNEMREDGTSWVWLSGAGSAAVALMAVSFRGFARAGGKVPVFETMT